MRPRHQRLLLALSLCVLLAGQLAAGRRLVLEATQPAPRPPAPLRFTLPSLDLGTDAHPATHYQAGYIELWTYPHDTEDVLRLLRIVGTLAVPAPPVEGVPS